MSTTVAAHQVDELLKEYKEKKSIADSLFIQKQQILSQLNENTLVQGELDMIDGDDEKVFKLVGPALISVELEEAKENVKKRLEFIELEIKKVESQITTKQEEVGTLGDTIASMQLSMQKEAAQAAQNVTSDA